MGSFLKMCVGMAASTALIAPAFAGEITGNGKSLKTGEHSLHGNSSCAFSGLNDTPFGDEATNDPGGRVQTYGYFHSQTWLGQFIGPNVTSPREPSPHPGWSCNPHKADSFIP